MSPQLLIALPITSIPPLKRLYNITHTTPIPQTLTAQLNPHFFFNALNSIKALVPENPQATRRAIDLLSDLLRKSLYRKEAGFISLQEEMEMVKDYLELEQIRLEKRLQTSITVAAALLP